MHGAVVKVKSFHLQSQQVGEGQEFQALITKEKHSHISMMQNRFLFFSKQNTNVSNNVPV